MASWSRLLQKLRDKGKGFRIRYLFVSLRNSVKHQFVNQTQNQVMTGSTILKMSVVGTVSTAKLKKSNKNQLVGTQSHILKKVNNFCKTTKTSRVINESNTPEKLKVPK